MRLVHFAHHGGRADVSVKGDIVAVLAEASVVEFGDGAAPEIVIVVEDPDFRGEAILTKQRAEVVFDESDFVFLRP